MPHEVMDEPDSHSCLNRTNGVRQIEEEAVLEDVRRGAARAAVFSNEQVANENDAFELRARHEAVGIETELADDRGRCARKLVFGRILRRSAARVVVVAVRSTGPRDFE